MGTYHGMTLKSVTEGPSVSAAARAPQTPNHPRQMPREYFLLVQCVYECFLSDIKIKKVFLS